MLSHGAIRMFLYGQIKIFLRQAVKMQSARIIVTSWCARFAIFLQN